MSDAVFIKRLRLLPLFASGNFNRPADTTSYAAGDLVANSTTAGSVVPLEVVAGNSGQVVMLRRLIFRKSSSTTTNAVFRVHVFTVAPTVSSGDNVGLGISTGAADYVGSFSVGAIRGMTDGTVGFASPDIGADIGVVLGSTGKLFCLIEALAAYAPANAETFTLKFEYALA